MNNNEKKQLLDDLVKEYNVSDFIQDDPIKFPHMFKTQNDIELAGLLSSSLAYGKREKILESVNKILEIMQFKPLDFVTNFDYYKDSKLFEGFVHRYTAGNDIALFLHAVGNSIKEFGSLKNIFINGYNENDQNVKNSLMNFVSTLMEFAPRSAELKGLKFLLPSPERGSACKRLNMYLRWMVRSGPVDLHLWNEINTSQLLIPLDTHVAKLSRKLQFTERKSNDWKTAEEITEKLKYFDPNDPTKYDFAIFGMGVNKNIPELI